MAEGISLAEQGSIAKEFLEGLLASMNIKLRSRSRNSTRRPVELSGQRESAHGAGRPRRTARYDASSVARSDAYGCSGQEPKSN